MRVQAIHRGALRSRTFGEGSWRNTPAMRSSRRLVGMVLCEQDDVRVGMMTDSPGMPPATMCPPTAVWLST